MNNLNINPLGLTAAIRDKFGTFADGDSYKLTHIPQYPKGLVAMVDYMESRGGMFDKTVWFGMQAVILDSLCNVLTHDQVDAIILFQKGHFMENCTEDLEIALRTIVDEYDGLLPIRIRAPREGSIIPVKNILASIESTVEDPRVASVVSYVETLLMRVWAPTTIATYSWHIREYIYEKLVETADAPDAEIDFKLHDFGSRGVSSFGTACINGAAHLVAFKGSDTVGGILAANIAYQCDMSAFSIPASEHSTTTMHGLDNEVGLVSNMFDAYAKPGAIFATVIDSRDWVRFIKEIAPQFKDRLEESSATWVFRPDSGDAVATPVKVVEMLDEVFGHDVNTKGFKVLRNVRVIQGDGIAFEEVVAICEELIAKGYSITNIAFGMGGGLLQKHDRDTQKFAIKCCAAKINDEWVDVYKDPAIYNPETWEKMTGKDANFKTSKKGRLELIHNNMTDEYKTVTYEDAQNFLMYDHWDSALHTVYENGKLVETITMDEVRENAGI